MKRILPFALAFALGALTFHPSLAADDPKPDPKEPKKDLEPARAAIAQKDWVRARALLREAVARHPESADAQNLYAFAIRSGPSPQMDLVFRHYNEALRINPKHLGAHEYLGEAYLMVGNVRKAREHLAILERLCGACEQQAKLAQAVANAETQHAAK